MMWPKNVLMVTPDFFDVTYAINPHMVDSTGALRRVDIPKAHLQWNQLKNGFEQQGLQVHTLCGTENLPDMVFSANQMFPFYKNNRVQFVLSRMKSAQRQQEVEFFQAWLQQKNIEFYKLPEGLSFEGMGDAVWNYEAGEIFGGHGYRTDPAVYDWLSDLTGVPITRLCLINDKFYHLDTALCVLNRDTALYVAEAFSSESVDKLKMKFKNLLAVPVDEAEGTLAANACSLDGRRVFVEAHAFFVQNQLRKLGFEVLSFDTSEFLKSGGSIFCLKLLF